MAGNTLTLSHDDWDLQLDPNGNIATSYGAYAIAQNVANAIRLFTEDAYYDRDRGIPHYMLDLQNKLNKPLVKSKYEEAAESIDGVLSATYTNIQLIDKDTANKDLTDRTLTGDLVLEVETGETVNVTI